MNSWILVCLALFNLCALIAFMPDQMVRPFAVIAVAFLFTSWLLILYKTASFLKSD